MTTLKLVNTARAAELLGYSIRSIEQRKQDLAPYFPRPVKISGINFYNPEELAYFKRMTALGRKGRRPIGRPRKVITEIELETKGEVA